MDTSHEAGSLGAGRTPHRTATQSQRRKTLIVDARIPMPTFVPARRSKMRARMTRYLSAPVYMKIRCFVADKPVRLVGAGRDQVQIYSRRGGPLYLQRVPNGMISGITFRYVGSDQHSAMNVLDSVCTITQCRAWEGILSGW